MEPLGGMGNRSLAGPIHPYLKPSIGTNQGLQRAEGLLRIVEMMEHAEAQHIVEDVLAKWRTLQIPLDHMNTVKVLGVGTGGSYRLS